MEDPLIVEGDWSLGQTRTVRNKLHIYFQSPKRSGGGDCRVEAETGAPRAAVYFSSAEARERVCLKKNHEITVDSKTIKLRVVSTSTPTAGDNVSDSNTSEVQLANEASAATSREVESVGVVLYNVSDSMSQGLLSILVANISGLKEGDYGVEILCETNRAVVTFNSPADVQRFLTASLSSPRLLDLGLTARPLEATKSIRVERLHPGVVEVVLEMYFETYWAKADNIFMMPNEQAAIVTFCDHRVVQEICKKKEHLICSSHAKTYPYYESLGTALYGKERPTPKMPEPFTERVDLAIWEFLQMKKLFTLINEQMLPNFCSVDFNTPEAKLSPLPAFVKQKGLTAKDVQNWMSTTQKAFRQHMAEYTVFECPASALVWSAAEKNIRSLVKEEAALVLKGGILMVAGRVDTIQRIRAPVENMIQKVREQNERETNEFSDTIHLSPAMFYILEQEGLQEKTLTVSPQMKLSYSEDLQQLNISGLPAEVYETKSWLLERKMHMNKKYLSVSSCLLDFLRINNAMDMSQALFTSQGICAFYTIENQGIFLHGNSENILTDAEIKMNTALTHCTLDLEDQEVPKLPGWVDLKQRLLDTHNASKIKTVAIKIPGREVTVAGFLDAVNEVSRQLKEFIESYSKIQETVGVKSCAVVHFLDHKRGWPTAAQNKDVTIHFDSEKPRIILTGARVHVQEVSRHLQELIRGLFTENYVVDKPGAKKYFQSHGRLFLPSLMKDFGCMVVLLPENHVEEEDDNTVDVNASFYCKVKTTGGVLVSVSKADICSLHVDAVVNAANEELKHIGGVALALLRAAGPELQNACTLYISKHGRRDPGDAVTTDAYALPSKYVIHTVGPRFSEYDKQKSVSRLKLAVKNSLKQAEVVKCCSIALPAISSGVFGFPVGLCAETIAEAVREYCDSPAGVRSLTDILLVDTNDNTVRALASAVCQEFKDLGPTKTEPQQASGGHADHSRRHQGGQSRNVRSSSGSPLGKRGEEASSRTSGLKGVLLRNRGGQSPVMRVGTGSIEQTTREGLRIVLCKGNIQEQRTDVIVNTMAANLVLSQGAVSNAILQAAGPGLQAAVTSAATAPLLKNGAVVITPGCNLSCQMVFHTVCPSWDNGAGDAEKTLISILRYCLDKAEEHKMASLSFPAIGTGNMRFPRDLVSRVLLREIQSFSRQAVPRHLGQVVVVVHPSDTQTVDCFTREFGGQTSPARQREPDLFQPPVSHPQQSPASFGQVLSPTLGVYRMQMGSLTLEVSSGDITKEPSDVIVNSSNQDFTLKSGVSKAILQGAGLSVEQECSQIVHAPFYQPSGMILTSAGLLPSRSIVHVVGQKDPAKIKELVGSVLEFCEEKKFSSVSFPALGTGLGGANPSAVADAMVDALVDFVRQKKQNFVHIVKILIFQAHMVTEFQKSMTRRAGENVEQKGTFAKFKDKVTSFFTGQEQTGAANLEREEFEATVFQLCADSAKAVSQAKRRIEELIVAEQAEITITDYYISLLSQADMDQLQELQRKLAVSIRLERGREDQEPFIHLEGLTRDVNTAESSVRNIIRKLERSDSVKNTAMLMRGQVEWQYKHSNGSMVAFDMLTNLSLEEALEKKQSVKIQINREKYTADVILKKAVSVNGQKHVELNRIDKKDAARSPLPSHWEDMKGDLVKLVRLAPGSQEYNDVMKELCKTGLSPNIISMERVQNVTLWQNYQLMKRQLEVTNKHKNNEKLLFHGTGLKAVDLINKQGFNRSYAGTHGAMYGNGSYFALDPCYSARGYAKPDGKGHKRMYLARVLVGDFTNGAHGLLAPPQKNSPNAADLYDSVTDNVARPTMFVIFNDIQAYPEFLITFT